MVKSIANWQTKKLGKVCDFEKSPNNLGRLPYVGMEDIESSTGKFIGSLTPRNVKSLTFRFNDSHLLFGRLRPYLNKVLLPTFEGHCSTEIFPIKVNSLLSKRFLFYWITSDETAKKINATCTGARMPRANMSQVLDFEILLPSIHEQQRIVKILDEVFEGLEKVKANTENNLKNAKELFESYLQSVFANPGKDWEEKTLNEVSTSFGRGKSKHRPRNDKKLYGGKYPFIQTGDIRNSDHLITKYSQTYNDTGLAQSKLWPKGTICITIAANIAETGILNFDACFPDSVIGIVANSKIADINFIEYLLQSYKVRLQVKGKGSAQKNINLETFENELFPFPLISEQKTIVTKLDALSVETKKLETNHRQKLADLEELKKSVLKKAFNGEL